jgi:hypothetical protein
MSVRRAGIAAMAAGLGIGAGGTLAVAQDSPAVQCIAAVQARLGGQSFLRAACASRQDCTYQAPIGNASAMALISSSAETVEKCWSAAGLARTDEQREAQGLIRTYAKPGETCKLLLSLSLGAVADGFRAACQSEKPR